MEQRQQRHVRLFAAHKDQVKWDGPAWFRTQQGNSRRLSTQLSKLAEACSVVLDNDEKATLQAAAALLGRLGGDFEVAVREAKQYADQLAQERAREKEIEREGIARTFIGDLDAAGLADFVRDIERLAQADEAELGKLLGHAAPRYNHVLLTHGVAMLATALAAGKTVEDPTAARKAIVLWLEASITEYGHYPSIPAASWRAWRAHRDCMRSLLSQPAFDPESESNNN